MEPEVEKLIEKVCQKLQCSQIATDLEKLNHARTLLTLLQQREVFTHIFDDKSLLDIETSTERPSSVPQQEKEELPPPPEETKPKQHVVAGYTADGPKDICSCETTDVSTDMLDWVSHDVECHEEEEEEVVCERVDRMHRYFFGYEPCYTETLPPPEDTWHGFFKGFQILREREDIDMGENKKCIEMTIDDTKDLLAHYIRTGVRCFGIDLFAGTDRENQALIVRMRECELLVSEEIGFPIRLTLFAKLSPRLQYTGLMMPSYNCVDMKKGDEFTLTSDRYWSSRSSRKRVYVNAGFLLDDIKPCDVIFIGQDLQVHVTSIDEDRMRVRVDQPGVLRSRIPVVFPSKCNYSRISVEELEDITFAKEVGIQIIVSYTAGTPKYLKDLLNCIKLLQCEKMRLFSRIVLNEIVDPEPEEKVQTVTMTNFANTEEEEEEDDEKTGLWMANAYDGFVIEVNLPYDQQQVELIEITTTGEKFLQRVYDLQKPVIFDPEPIAQHKVIIDPLHYVHFFLYPDKYLYRGALSVEQSFYFSHLQTSLFTIMPEMILSNLPYCDKSETGADSLARSCVAAAFEMNASIILVCSYTGRMAIKISHFRPRVPIVLITAMQSATHFVSVYHNILNLYFPITSRSHRKTVYKQLLFGLVYAQARKLLRHGDHALLVFSRRKNTYFNDKFVAYKFDERRYTEHLEKIVLHE